MNAPSLTEIFDLVDSKNLTTQINIARSEDRWQVSMKRPKGGSVFSVSVKPTLIEAIVDCLGVEAGLARKNVSYWYHPESESAFAVPGGCPLPEECDEIDHDQYLELTGQEPEEEDDGDDWGNLI